MEILELIAAFGFGVIASKCIDAFWIQPFLVKSETRKWLREQRLNAYVRLASNIMSFGLSKGSENSVFDDLAELTPSILLTDDDRFYSDVYGFIAKRALMKRLADGSTETDEDPKKLYDELLHEAKEIVSELRSHLRN